MKFTTATTFILSGLVAGFVEAQSASSGIPPLTLYAAYIASDAVYRIELTTPLDGVIAEGIEALSEIFPDLAKKGSSRNQRAERQSAPLMQCTLQWFKNESPTGAFVSASVDLFLGGH